MVVPVAAVDSFYKKKRSTAWWSFCHSPSFFVLAAFTAGKFLPARQNAILAVIAILYGLSDEIHQAFVPYRSATVIDFVKDTLGVLAAFYFVNRAHAKNRFDWILAYFAGKTVKKRYETSPVKNR